MITTKQSIGLLVLVLLISSTIYISGIARGWYGEPMTSGQPSPPPQGKHEVIGARTAVQQDSANSLGVVQDKQILFGDLHTHTSYSMDAYIAGLPLRQGDGVHPPADACDFARYCSALDFFSYNDHAESLTPDRWRETKQSVRQCNAIAGDPANPDLVAFLGWEWTQADPAPENFFGHKNIVLLDTAEEKVPSRAIAAMGAPLRLMQKANSGILKYAMPALDPLNRQAYYDLERFIQDTKTPFCEEGVDVRDLPQGCMEYAATPAELYTKLRQWAFPSIVIPHGTGVGQHAPVGATWLNQLLENNHDPALQTMFEVYSGHGSSEQYRDWRAARQGDDGKYYCPEPRADYLPMCWQAGEIIRQRCLEDGLDSQECDQRARLTRQYAAEAGKNAYKVVPGTSIEEWLDAGSCRDCFLPTNEMRPTSNAQAALATRNFSASPGQPDRFKFALMSSSDTHTARSGNGYKEVQRHHFADVDGYKSTRLAKMTRKSGQRASIPQQISSLEYGKFTERSKSFSYTGGLVAVHAEGRDRHAIWDALQNKEVYGTSGPRMLLWFDLLNGPGPENEQGLSYAMGAELEMATTPRFRVRAAGSFRQKPGCPDYSIEGLGPDRLARLCLGECYNPSDERYRISRIEVVKITPQSSPTEDLSDLIQDTWQSFDCPQDGRGCIIEFEDPEFSQENRDTLYYVRAIQEATPTVNGGQLRCEYNEDGQCIKVNPCYVDERTDASDNCLMNSEHRAWSSPIFIDYLKQG